MNKDTTTFAEEFEGAENLTPEQVDTQAPEQTVKATPERKTYTLLDGTEGSRSAFIKEQYMQLGKSRKAIAEEFGFDYRAVYSATVNLSNGADEGTRGRASVNAMIKVNNARQYVEIKPDAEGNPLTYVNGELTDVVYTDEELTTVSRNDWIKEMVAAGMAKGAIAKILDVSYGVVYGQTKDMGSSRTTHMVITDDGVEMPRAEYIRQLEATGMSKGDIAKKLGVEYSVVWQATKKQKTDQEKFTALIESLEGYTEKVDEREMFADAIATLKAIKLVDNTAEEAKEAAAEAAAEEEASEVEASSESEAQ